MKIVFELSRLKLVSYSGLVTFLAMKKVREIPFSSIAKGNPFLILPHKKSPLVTTRGLYKEFEYT
jgi:hypothetical protein